MEILGKILGSGARVKVMRLFLLNKSKVFNNKEVVKRSQVAADTTRRELKNLASIGFVKKRGQNWFFNPAFKYAYEMESLLVNSNSVDKEGMANNFKKVGKVKLLLISGV